MINTIFYFTDTELEYLDNYAQGSVKPHTICFAKDTKTIWRDGLRFSGLRQDEVDDEIHNLTDEAINDLNEGVLNLETGLNNAVQAAAEEKIRLNGLINNLDNEISNVATDLTTTAAAIRNEVRNGELYTSEGWDPKVNAYLKTVGLWDYGTGDTQHVTKWSTLRQSVSNVSSEVNRVEAKADGYNNTLQSKINQEVTDRGEAVTTLSNTFAKSTKDLQGVIEWMYSGFHSGAAQDMSYAEIIAAGKNGASSAISDLRTSIETTSDGKYVAQSSLTSSVDSAISGIVNDVTGKYANTSIFSQIDTNSDNIAAINTFIGPDVAQSTLAAKLNGAEAGAVATVKNDLATMHILSKSGNNYTADVYTKSQTNNAIKNATASMATTDDLQRSMGLVYTKTEADSRTNQLISEAGLVSENEFTAASIIAKVNGASSSVKINADHINIDANHQLDLSAQTITIDADDINLNGQTNFENAIGNWITTKGLKISDVDGEIKTVIESGNATFSGDVIAKTLTAGNTSTNGLNIHTTGNQIQFRLGSDNRAYFVSNGSGLQLYVKDENGEWHYIDFANWKSASSGDYTTLTFYNYTINTQNDTLKLQPILYYYNSDTGLYYTSPNSGGVIPSGTTIDVYELGTATRYYTYKIVRLLYGLNKSYDTDDPLIVSLPVYYLRKVQLTRNKKTLLNSYMFISNHWTCSQVRCDGDPEEEPMYQYDPKPDYEIVNVSTSDKSAHWAENPEDSSYGVRVSILAPAANLIVPATQNNWTVYSSIPFSETDIEGLPESE